MFCTVYTRLVYEKRGQSLFECGLASDNAFDRGGILYPVMKMGQKLFFCRADVQALDRQLIFAGEMTRLLAVPASCIGHLVREGALQAVSKPTTREKGCYIFDRAYFMTWHQEHILMPEMRTLVSDLKALQRRLKAKGIGPVVKFPSVYCRKEVMGVINQ